MNVYFLLYIVEIVYICHILNSVIFLIILVWWNSVRNLIWINKPIVGRVINYLLTWFLFLHYWKFIFFRNLQLGCWQTYLIAHILFYCLFQRNLNCYLLFILKSYSNFQLYFMFLLWRLQILRYFPDFILFIYIIFFVCIIYTLLLFIFIAIIHFTINIIFSL